MKVKINKGKGFERVEDIDKEELKIVEVKNKLGKENGSHKT